MRGGRCALRCGSDHCAPCTGFGVCEPARHEMRHEGGSAPVEFIGWTLILVVPVLYLLVAFAQVQSASFAVASAADAAGRVLEVERGGRRHGPCARRGLPGPVRSAHRS